MSTDEGERSQRFPRYDGEDTRVTTRKELMGWYAYGVGAEVFAVCGVGSFLPVLLEQLARERGVLWSDKTTPCVAKVGPGNSRGSNALMAALVARASAGKESQCVINLFGSEITTTSFAMYTFSIAVLVQALALISFSSVADHGPYRKRFLLCFGFTGAVTSMLFLLVTPRVYLLGAILLIIGVTCLGSSFNLLNSFLPLLVSNHPLIRGRRSSDIALEAMASTAHDANLAEYDEGESHPMTASSELQLSAKISSKGAGTGYMAAVFVQCLSIGLLFALSKASLPSTSPTLPLRIVLFFVGAWWLAFTIPTALWLRPRPGPALPTSTTQHANLARSALSHLLFAWSSLFQTLKLALQLRQALLFLAAWFLLSDGIATISSTAILFARTELHLSTIATAALSITSTASAVAGALAWPRLQHRLSLPSTTLLVLCLALMELIPLYGLLGFLPAVRRAGVGGLQQPWEIFPLALVHGLAMAGLSSYCRAVFGVLVPPGAEAAFFALYAVTDKGSSAVGPAVVGRIVDAAGTIRPAFGFLAVLVAAPGPLVWALDVERGRADALR
ncbi:hypothetical protein AOQ84DRAFT_336699, partial [Glonium stellatum]